MENKKKGKKPTTTGMSLVAMGRTLPMYPGGIIHWLITGHDNGDTE